jgi:hypothetical protein
MFSISATGALTPVPGSPTPDLGASGIDCNCASTQLFVALNGSPNSVVDVFDIGLTGTLSRIVGSPFNGPGINSNVALLSPDDSKLFVSAQDSNTVTVFSVASGGALSVVAGSPFAVPGATSPSGIATNQAGTLLYSAAFNNLINGFSIGPTGALTSVTGSPFSNGFPADSGLLSLAVFPGKNCCPAPVISDASATPNVLWPPNHKMVAVTIDYTVTDPCPNTCVLTVSSNEPVNGIGDGNTSPDWQVIDAHHVLLRAERSGPGSGRIYTLDITCTNDTNKLSSTKTLRVVVPHDQDAFFVAHNYLDFHAALTSNALKLVALVSLLRSSSRSNTRITGLWLSAFIKSLTATRMRIRPLPGCISSRCRQCALMNTSRTRNGLVKASPS